MIVYSGPGEFGRRYFQENDQRSEARIFSIAKYCGGENSCIMKNLVASATALSYNCKVTTLCFRSLDFHGAVMFT
jgi:hypothetical protein